MPKITSKKCQKTLLNYPEKLSKKVEKLPKSLIFTDASPSPSPSPSEKVKEKEKVKGKGK